MKPAPNIPALKKRVDRYLWGSRDPKALAFRQFYSDNLKQFSRTAIIGGLLRDFALNGRYGFKSDIDVVIDADSDCVSRLAEKIGAKNNKYGGFSIEKNYLKIDFWCLSSTWTAKYANVDLKSLEDVVNATFFDWDSILYIIESKKIVCKKDYIEKIVEREMDIVIAETPSKFGNLQRAIARVLKWNLIPGPSLEKFIRENLTADIAQDIIRKFQLPESNDDNFDLNKFLNYISSNREEKNGEFCFDKII